VEGKEGYDVAAIEAAGGDTAHPKFFDGISSPLWQNFTLRNHLVLRFRPKRRVGGGGGHKAGTADPNGKYRDGITGASGEKTWIGWAVYTRELGESTFRS